MAGASPFRATGAATCLPDHSEGRPRDGNTTVVSILAFESDGKRQDILTEAVPGLHLMAALSQAATVLQLPARPMTAAEADAQKRVTYVG